MIEKLLASCLGPVVAAERQLRRRRLVISLLSIGALGCAAFTALALHAAWWSWPAVIAFFGSLALAALVGLSLVARRGPGLREIARRIEDKHPDLRAALLAAMDQKPGPGGELGYLQQRLFGEISEHALRHRWVRQVTHNRLVAAGWGQFLALAAFIFGFWTLLGEAPMGRGTRLSADATADAAEAPAPPAMELRVSPGDVELEKGSRLVVEASFSGRAPAAATLVHRHAGGETHLPMQAGLDDSVFSALIPKVDTGGDYRVVYEGAASEHFDIAVFEYPELAQADAVVTEPDYLGGGVETIADTRKITVMEGSRVEWRLRVNKPLAAAELFGEDGDILTLTQDPADPALLVASHEPAKTQRYRVHLVDEKDRANRRPPWLSVTVKENLPPKLKLTFPGRDFDVSALQELPLEAEVWDDVGVLRSGMSYLYKGEETEVVLTEEPLDGKATHPLATLIDVESLGAKERDLIVYYFWAEDHDREGKVRRSASDRFFAEVRLFEEIVREGAPGGGGQGGTPEGGQSDELLRIQKDIVNAAWKLIRDHDLGKAFESYAEDVGVVRESQLVAIAKLDEAAGEVEDASLRGILLQAREHMDRAATQFGEVSEKQDGTLLAAAMGSATEAYAELLKARARETEVSMSNSPSQSGSQSQQQQQRNMNLELEQRELKYQEQSMAESPAISAEQQENLAVLNRLKDLARRQEAIAEKIKELENQLRNAKGEEEKAEIERQLKRLQEEQRELLREMDDLGERMDSEQNRADMSEAREELKETRDSVQETAENLEDGNLADAANSATRASEQLEEMKEEFRERTSRQFSNEMKALRDASRELAEQQQAIGERLEPLAEASESAATDERRRELAELAQSVNEQAAKLDETLESMRTLSEQAEASEPLLSDALYEAVRNAQMNDLEGSLGELRDLTFYNRPAQARAAAEAASRGVEELKDRVEKAAEKILGSEADALRLARSELDKLIAETEAETERLASNEGREGTEPGQAGDPTGSGQAGESKEEPAERGIADAKGQGQSPGQGTEETPGEPGEGESRQASKEKGKGKGEAPGEGKGEGELAESSAQPGEGRESSEGKGKGKGQGEEPGEGAGEGESQQASKEKGKGQGQGEGEGESPAESMAETGKGKGQGKGQGQGQEEGEGEGPSPGEGQGRGETPGERIAEGRGQGQGSGTEGREDRPGEPGSPEGGRTLGANRPGGGGALNYGGDDRGEGRPTGGNLAGPLFFDEASEQREPGPITGEDYERWAERLGNVEEMIPQEDLRNELARVRDNARAMRIDFRRNDLPPGAATINQRITRPLVALRQRLSEELAKLNRENPVAPIDRDPVPSEFRDLVRRYYEELGAGD